MPPYPQIRGLVEELRTEQDAVYSMTRTEPLHHLQVESFLSITIVAIAS
jgi:hypothetical protein